MASILPESIPTTSATIGRVMSTLLDARPKKLQDAICRPRSSLEVAPLEGATNALSLEQSICFLHKYIKDTAAKGDPLDEVLIPMIVHALKIKDSKHNNQAMILLNWLFQDELVFKALATGFTGTVLRKNDRYVTLGWSVLARSLIEYEITMDNLVVNGIRDNYNRILKILSPCIKHLLCIICNGSTFHGGFELPNRLSVGVADFILSYTVALTKTGIVSDGSNQRSKSTKSSAQNLTISMSHASIAEKKANSTTKSAEHLNEFEMTLLLWEHLDEVIILVQRLIAWSRKSRPLHASGLERVMKWLEETKQQHNYFQNEAGSQSVKSGAMLLASCWKHYGQLLHLEYYKFSKHCEELLDQYFSGFQFYADKYREDCTEDKDIRKDTIKFFLNCLCLLLGRFDSKQFERAMIEFGPQLSKLLVSQLHSVDDEVVCGAVCILKAVIFKATNLRCGNSLPASREMSTILTVLLNFLDEQNSAARAIAALIAEYCILSLDKQCIQEVLKRLTSENIVQRTNAMEVISGLFNVALDSEIIIEKSIMQDVANHLLERLGDEESKIQSQASNLITRCDPFLILPALIRLLYFSDKRVQSSASETLVATLKFHNQEPEVICMLIDCLSNPCPSLDSKDCRREVAGPELDTDEVLKLIPEWSKTVKNWKLLIEGLIDKLFAEPSNATIVKFLSCISEYLAEAVDVVLHRLLLNAGPRGIDDSCSKLESGTCCGDKNVTLQQSLFLHLCPLLVIRMLPLKIFDDLSSSLMYGELINKHNTCGVGNFGIDDNKCVATLLLNRAFNNLEFEDVRKLSAELCGRLHPQVLYPIISSQLQCATCAVDLFKIKTCLFSMCTSFVARGWDAILHHDHDVLKIRKTIETVLLWPLAGRTDEVSKVQHGCIDCLALMICKEQEAPKLLKGSAFGSTGNVGYKADALARNLVLPFVIHRLTQDGITIDCSDLGREMCKTQATLPVPFRLCLANVLISACQKIRDSCKSTYAESIFPRLISSVELIKEPEIRAACVQVLFSAAYHLKSAVLRYASDLLKIAIKSLTKESKEERVAGAKLLASLMASEEAVVERIAEDLLESKSLLSSLSLSDPSPEIQQMCRQLLMCLTS